MLFVVRRRSKTDSWLEVLRTFFDHVDQDAFVGFRDLRIFQADGYTRRPQFGDLLLALRHQIAAVVALLAGALVQRITQRQAAQDQCRISEPGPLNHVVMNDHGLSFVDRIEHGLWFCRVIVRCGVDRGVVVALIVVDVEQSLPGCIDPLIAELLTEFEIGLCRELFCGDRPLALKSDVIKYGSRARRIGMRMRAVGAQLRLRWVGDAGEARVEEGSAVGRSSASTAHRPGGKRGRAMAPHWPPCRKVAFCAHQGSRSDSGVGVAAH